MYSGRINGIPTQNKHSKEMFVNYYEDISYVYLDLTELSHTRTDLNQIVSVLNHIRSVLK